MSVDRAEVERIAALARLRLTDHEVERFTGELNDILGHVEALRSLEDASTDVGPDDREPAPMRATEEEAPDALALAPEAFAPRWTDGFFVVPPPPGIQASDEAS